MNRKLLLLATAILLSATAFAQPKLKYYDADNLPVYGRATDQGKGRYERLPASYESISRAPLYQLGRNSAGIYIRFRSNTGNVYARWESLFKNHMAHMADTGTRGLDIYVLENGTWKFLGTGFPSNEKVSDKALVKGMKQEEREYMLYLSLYDGVSKLEIGIDEDATIDAPKVDSPRAGHPIVFYGTSILQGGCCSRPGMAFTNILARRFDRETINLGFSGNGQLDLEVAELMAKIPDPSIYVLDNVPNSSPEQIRERGEKFFRILRDAHPDVPIIFIDDPFFAHYGYDQKMTQEIDRKDEAEAELFNKLKKSGEKNIYYIQRKHTVGTDCEPFVDGIHYTDLGMQRYADYLYPIIKKHMLK